jgi:hypothetical protein
LLTDTLECSAALLFTPAELTYKLGLAAEVKYADLITVYNARLEAQLSVHAHNAD